MNSIIEQGGRFTPENKIPQTPKPMSFEEFDAEQARPKDEQGNEYEPTEKDKTKAYSAYVQLFYEDLKAEQKRWTELYSSYVQYFYTSGAQNAYDKETNPKPMTFEEFKAANRQEKE